MSNQAFNQFDYNGCKRTFQETWWLINSALNPVYLQVGTTVAKNRRAVTSKSYDFFVETTFLESHEEVVKDLYQLSHREANGLAIVEDAAQGWNVQVTFLFTHDHYLSNIEIIFSREVCLTIFRKKEK